MLIGLKTSIPATLHHPKSSWTQDTVLILLLAWKWATTILVAYGAFGLDNNKMRSAWEEGSLDFASVAKSASFKWSSSICLVW